ncbi:hypothetical protein D9757_002746 [Collybiopsis confluens]|uniref:Uncharacterized protein n=1 Tax=Collybiopsis confluens TaxID=2823264 RepID=A0A8H5HWF2_9AGAR|nr:hypothetical protein D9757_002746 [Collybiopsis confluens]
MMDTAETAHFQAAIPFLLQPLSSELAALHAHRASRANSDQTLSTCHCKSCGYYLFAGDSTTRVVRPRRPVTSSRTEPLSSTRARQSTCLQCGHVTEFVFNRGSPLFHSRKRPKSGNLPIAGPTPTAATAPSVKSKSRPKKKGGLQEMLAQKRAKEEEAKKSLNHGQSSLAAFLDAL